MTVSLQVSWHSPSCHRVIFPLMLTLAPVNSLRTEERCQAWEKAKRGKKRKVKKRSSMNHRKIGLCVFTRWHLESRCVRVEAHDEGWRWAPSTGHSRIYTFITLHYISLHSQSTDRCRTAPFISIHLIQNRFNQYLSFLSISWFMSIGWVRLIFEHFSFILLFYKHTLLFSSPKSSLKRLNTISALSFTFYTSVNCCIERTHKKCFF